MKARGPQKAADKPAAAQAAFEALRLSVRDQLADARRDAQGPCPCCGRGIGADAAARRAADALGVDIALFRKRLSQAHNLTLRSLSDTAWALGQEVRITFRKVPRL